MCTSNCNCESCRRARSYGITRRAEPDRDDEERDLPSEALREYDNELPGSAHLRAHHDMSVDHKDFLARRHPMQENQGVKSLCEDHMKALDQMARETRELHSQEYGDSEPLADPSVDEAGDAEKVSEKCLEIASAAIELGDERLAENALGQAIRAAREAELLAPEDE